MAPNDTFREIGRTGLERHGGRVYEEFLPQLSGDRAIQVYKEMRDNDPTIGALLFAIDKLIRQVEWRVEAKGDSPAEVEAKEFVEQCMNDMTMTWADFISEVIRGMLPFGWSYHEIVYKRRQGRQSIDSKVPTSKYDDGKIGWHKFGVRAQETLYEWSFDEGGGIRGMIQMALPDYVPAFIPIEKSILFRTEIHKNNPEGRSILRNAYRPWYFKKMIEEIEGIGIERDLAGFPIMYVDPEIMAGNAPDWKKQIYADYKEVVANIRRDKQEGLILPSLYDDDNNQLYRLELLSSGGARAFDTSGIIERYDKRITMTVLADFILLGSQAVGSFALSSDKTDLFAVALGAWLQSIGDTINRYAVERLFAVNGMDIETMPEIVYGDIEKPDLGPIGAFIGALTAAGMPLFPDTNLENFLRQQAGLPELTDEEQERRSKEPQQPALPAPTPEQNVEDDQAVNELTGER